MPTAFRKLNEEGIHRFAHWIAEGAQGAAPRDLLTTLDTSEPLAQAVIPAQRSFTDRFEFGNYLGTLLAGFDLGAISHDHGMWTALALFWFDQLCPADTNGQRKVEKDYRYVLSSDFRHYYRHLVRSPWQLVRDHGANARFLLLPQADSPHPLR